MDEMTINNQPFLEPAIIYRKGWRISAVLSVF